ncbi:MAG TPA: phosphate ABC transporter permease subunit PstC [Treponema sp.]|nr:phosphate ABC transporter permease subunit PstC [Treponema sp.]
MNLYNRETILKEYPGKIAVTVCGILVIVLTLSIGFFLLVKGMGTFTIYKHNVLEFLFSSEWKPEDTGLGGGKVGALIYIVGSLLTCGLALIISVPFSFAAAVFMTEIQPVAGTRILQPAVSIFAGIPSVVYGWLGLTLLVPFIKNLFNLPHGFTVLSASLVLALMILPTITTVTADAIRAVPEDYREGAYALGATRWQVIHSTVLPAAKNGIFTAVILGLSRAFGEALAVAMVIGKMKSFPSSILSPTTTLTTAIASDMGGAMDGGEYNMALWTMALLLYLISLLFIFIIHMLSAKKERD